MVQGAAMLRILVPVLLLLETACVTVRAGDRSKPIDLVDLNGNQVRAADLQGRVTIVDFYATWCGPCQTLRPILEKIARDVPQIQLVIVDVGETKGWTMAAFDSKNVPTNMRIVPDTQSDVRDGWGVSRIPTTFVIDGEGVVRFVSQGIRPELEAQLREVIRRLLP
jgi:thiol-disulfide isomerase/thioredoxin